MTWSKFAYRPRETVTLATEFDGSTVKTVESPRIGVRYEIHRDRKGRKTYELHYRYEELHRENGPAQIIFGDDGNPTASQWYRRGEPHRIDGPAEVAPATSMPDRFFFRSVECADLDEVIGRLADAADRFDARGPVMLGEELRASSYRPLLTGHTAQEILDVLLAGVHTVEGIREVFGGAPVEWVRSYERAVRA